jgi:hypothetical protein
MQWKQRHTALVLLFIVLVAGLCALATQLSLSSKNHLGLWFTVALGVLVLALMFVIGDGIVGRVQGILIDSRNRVSLKNFQLVAWTLVVLTAYGGVFLTNLLAGESAVDALNISVPPELWAALGVSGATFVTAKAITADQGTKSLKGAAVAPPAGIAAKGKLAVKNVATDASWGDMFVSDIIGNSMNVDISKVQMFFFTVVLAIGYMAAVVNLLISTTKPIGALPSLNSAFVIVLAISQGGYLGRKATGYLN